MAKDTWLTEAEICDQLESSGLLWQISGCLKDENRKLLREQPVLRNYRPDFIAAEWFTEDDGYGCYGWLTPIEVKITATADAVIQLQGYAQILEIELQHCQVGQRANAFEMGRPKLIARYFDQKVVDLVSLLSGECYRIECEGPQIVSLQLLEPAKSAFSHYCESVGKKKARTEFSSEFKKIFKSLGVHHE